MRTREDIIRYARELRREYHTQNPYKLAEHFGIRVVDGFHTDVSRKAFTVKMEAYPTMIMLNAAYDKSPEWYYVHTSWDMLCCMKKG